MAKTLTHPTPGRMFIEIRRSGQPNPVAIKEAAKDVARTKSKGVTAAMILQKIKAAR